MFTGLVEDVGTVARADRRSDALVLGDAPDADSARRARGRRIGLPRRRVPDRHRRRPRRVQRARRRRDARAHHARQPARRQARQPRALAARSATGSAATGSPATSTAPASSPRAATSARTWCSSCARRPRCCATSSRRARSRSRASSLTVNAVDAETFSVAIIPHTRDMTTLGELAIGDRVNLEIDILAKHVEKLSQARTA